MSVFVYMILDTVDSSYSKVLTRSINPRCYQNYRGLTRQKGKIVILLQITNTDQPLLIVYLFKDASPPPSSLSPQPPVLLSKSPIVSHSPGAHPIPQSSGRPLDTIIMPPVANRTPHLMIECSFVDPSIPIYLNTRETPFEENTSLNRVIFVWPYSRTQIHTRTTENKNTKVLRIYSVI